MSSNKQVRKIRIGIAGAGWVAEWRHIPAFRKDKRVEIVAIYDINEEKLKKVSAEFGIKNIYTALDEFLGSSIDVVCVCTPPYVHAEIIKSALDAGKHVLTEKPMTLCAREGEMLERLAEKKKLILCTSHNFLFSHAMLEVKSMMALGRIGSIVNVTAIQWSSWKRNLPEWFNKLPGGLFFDESPHFFYLMKYFLGDVKIIEAKRKVWGEQQEKKSEHFDISIQGERGRGTVTMWLGAPISEWVIIVAATKGVLVIDLFRDLITFTPEETPKRYFMYLRSFSTILQFFKGIIKLICIRLRGEHLLFGADVLAYEFISAIISGKEQPVPPSDGWNVVGLIEDSLVLVERDAYD